MPEASSTPNLVALPITIQELGRRAFLPPPTKIGLSNSPTTIGLNKLTKLVIEKYRDFGSISNLGALHFEDTFP